MATSASQVRTQSHCAHAKDAERDALIVRNIPLVKYVLGKVAPGLPHWVDREDLLEAGILGLIDAAKKYDPSRAVAFNTYAVVRIRGAMLDEIRAMDWLPRSARDKVDRLRGAQRELMRKQQHRPSPTELAQELGVPETEVLELLQMADGNTPVSLEQSLQQGQVPSLSPDAPPFIREADAPGEHLEFTETHALLTEAIAELPERERRIILLHYYRGMRLREIAGLLHLSDSRVGQLRRQALEHLKRIMRRRAPETW